MKYSYDPNGMRNVSNSVDAKLREFHVHSEAVRQIVTGLSASWSDPVNQQFATKYLQQGLTTCDKLEKTVNNFSILMRQCAQRYGAAIDKGNTFFNSF